MRTLACLALAIAITGCATSPQDHTTAFLAEEKKVVATCLLAFGHLSLLDKLEVDTRKGHSPFYYGAKCYADQIVAVALVTGYPHAATVNHFAQYQLALAGARDRGEIDKPTTAKHYNQAYALFHKSLGSRDAAMATVDRKELASRLSIFLAALSNLAAEQDRQRLARRPTNCFLTGIYQTTGVTCM